MSQSLQRKMKLTQSVTQSVIIQSVILNLFQDLNRSRVRRSRNEFGMTGVKNDRDAGRAGMLYFRMNEYN